MRVDQVSTIEYDPGQTEMHRDGLRQSIAVTARLEGSDLGTAIKSIQAQLAKDVHLPAGMTLEYGGLYQEQQASFRELAITLALAVALVFLVLLIEFRSFAHPVAIVTGAVLALTGSLAALLVTRTTLNVVSLMGMIMIVGIVAKNGILMLDTVEDHLEAGDDLHGALVRSGRRRFRAHDIPRGDAGNVAAGIGARLGRRASSAAGHRRDRRPGLRAAAFADRHSDRLLGHSKVTLPPLRRDDRPGVCLRSSGYASCELSHRFRRGLMVNLEHHDAQLRCR